MEHVGSAILQDQTDHSLADVASGATEFPRTLDQAPLTFRLFPLRNGGVCQPVNHSPRQLGSLGRRFAAWAPFRITT
jgi:hypothetical protein